MPHVTCNTLHAEQSEASRSTDRVRLLDLGFVSPLRSQTVYHAVAYAMTEETPNTIILVSPDRPYVCAGYHQDIEKEVDLAYCRERELPVYRREVGGGAVYLDNGQLFAQWIFHADRLPRELQHRFALFAHPLVETYRALGIDAYYRPVNDIHVSGKKIGGTGAAQIGAAEVVVGSLMFDFDRPTMARVLKVSSEKMRDKIVESLEAYMTTMREQLGSVPDSVAVKEVYLQKCAEALDAEILPGAWSAAEEAVAVEIDARFTSDEWLYGAGGGSSRRVSIKISEDVRVAEGAYKAPGGLIRATVRLKGGRIDALAFSGDFTLLPAIALGRLAQALHGLEPAPDGLTSRLEQVYQTLAIQSPGVAPQHFSEALLAATLRQAQGDT